MPQYAFLGHLRINGRVTLSTHTHSFTWSRICVELSSAVFKICDQWSVDVSSILRSEFHCMQSVICRLQSVVCSLQSANVRHRVRSPRRSFFPGFFHLNHLRIVRKRCSHSTFRFQAIIVILLTKKLPHVMFILCGCHGQPSLPLARER